MDVDDHASRVHAITNMYPINEIAQDSDRKGTIPHRRRLLGAYYTPDSLAKVLATWALAKGCGNVLDPSFGRGAFLNGATAVLSEQGVQAPGNRVFGVDVDPACMEYVRANQILAEKNFVVGDFLSLTPRDVPGAPFHSIIGNPPYIRHHWFSGSTRDAGRAAMKSAGVALPATASVWAYFVVHSLGFLTKRGRLAMLVPEAILQANYAVVVRRLLISQFNSVILVYIRDRVFQRTDEAVVAVAASDYGNSGSLRVEAVESVDDLPKALDPPKCERNRSNITTMNGRIIDPVVVALLDDIVKNTDTETLSDSATVEVGLVTGANRYFILSRDSRKELGVPCEACLRIVTRTRWLSGLDVTEHDIQQLTDAGERTFLICPTDKTEDLAGVRRWIGEGVEASMHMRSKCAIRRPWFRIPLRPVPHAFVTCARRGAPLLVLNRARCYSTNAIHFIRWKAKRHARELSFAVGFLTVAVRLWAELHGRRYGGGVLKMEPGTLKGIPVPIVPGAEALFDEANELIRDGREEEARELADDLVLNKELGVTKSDIRKLQRASARLKLQRSPVRSHP